jgi:hypothetical protein
VEFGAVGELPEAVRHADSAMYARRRERPALAVPTPMKPAEQPLIAVAGAETLGQG